MQIVWFKRDLRIFDHEPLRAAAKVGPVMCLYIVEPEYWRLPDTSARQWQAVEEGLRDLDSALCARYGAKLVLRIGDGTEVLRELHTRHRIGGLWSHQETGNLWTYARDRKIASFCGQSGIAWRQFQQFGVFRGLLDRDHWASKWEAFMAQPQVAPPARMESVASPAPTWPTLEAIGLVPDPCPSRQKGGRAAGIDCLDSFLDHRGARYPKEMSSPLTAPSACSRLSLHIATGTLSMREIVQHVYEHRRRLAANHELARQISLRALDAFISRLHWHCHFIQKLESEPELEIRSVHPLQERERHKVPHNEAQLQAWINGRTGFPFLDACMRSLTATGWINFRMRAMLMAFASYHLALDWTKSGTALARLFTDYEPGIHWPQVQMQSGQTGINIPRMYNPVKQSFDQDANGAFIRQWVLEIAHLPQAFLHEPWRMDDPAPAQYPARIVDHLIAARAARERLTQVQQIDGYASASKKVFVRHGSRNKRELRPNAAKQPKPQPKQFVFEF